jgi:transcription-repair coupling factor (superfamily II helicase)
MNGLKTGEVDCVIGTHRLLAADVRFKDLGLLVVDEEQRFGVHHKEQIKKLKTNVDVLTLSATPIPRTLEMSLVGIRDLSLLQTPPADRMPILTYVGEYDVLVCTTIIESGIDMPTVNTLVVERSDLLGLGQMHQLRGRVGRSGQRAYAYLFHPRDKVLSEEAYERLRTIGESTDLGSGFKIAMRDLEIRGAGNLLGESQSGHIAAVGYDLYCQMVTEAVSEMKGEPAPDAPSEIKLDVPTDDFLPTDYVAKEELRLEAYRRLAAVTSAAEVDDIRTEWEDRYGPLPDPATALLQVGHLRAQRHRLGIDDIQISPSSTGAGSARLAPLELKLSETMRLRRLSKGAKYKEDLRQLVVPLPRRTDPSTYLAGFLADLVSVDD